MKPIVSVVVPVYNTAADLPRCLDAILSQTLRDIEVVCVDDGSTDGSADVLREYAAKDPRIVAVFQENHGVEWARAVALERARGKYVMFCDSDDAYRPQACERMVAAVETNGTEMAVCGFDPSGWRAPSSYLDNATPEARARAPVREMWSNVWLWNKIFAREVIVRTGLSFPKDPRVRRGCDAVFTFLYSLAVEDATFLPDHLVEHRKRAGSITSLREGMKLRTTLDGAANLPRILEFVDRNGFYARETELILRWLDHRIERDFILCNKGQRGEALRLFSEALSSRSGDIRPEHRWLRAVLAGDERALPRRLRFQRVADAITIVLGRLGLRVWLRDLLLGSRPSSPSGR